MTKFTEIYDKFLKKIEAYKYAEMFEEDSSEIFRDFLMSAISQFSRVCRKDLFDTAIDTDTGEEYFSEELSPKEQNILAHLMVVYHIDTEIVTEDNLNNFLNSRDYRQYSSANLIDKVKELRRMYMMEADMLMSQYDFLSYRDEILAEGKDKND